MCMVLEGRIFILAWLDGRLVSSSPSELSGEVGWASVRSSILRYGMKAKLFSSATFDGGEWAQSSAPPRAGALMQLGEGKWGGGKITTKGGSAW
eukprot:CAMPEP_0114519454 /NCGR_PEP_ID=MMETSP0109-20121206/19016_1 /TAXON_ID=29199 /ORGANISM="Chlorarachnion reptans, Strain CCCM449" /LENGTH=93 /DNA_ID=CAMNT_0001700203 /DNA_START=1259 /DNA_END=1537 /DNA_ORIENTATION=-